MLLAIDTTTRSASVALFDGTHVVASRSWRSVVNHSAELMPSVIQVLQSRDATTPSLDAVAVALGPGGFSALRTGLSVAKGMAMASRLPIIGVSSLELEAYPFRCAGQDGLRAAGGGARRGGIGPHLEFPWPQPPSRGQDFGPR